MTAREKILSSIATGKPAFVAHPDFDGSFAPANPDLVKLFSSTLEGIGGRAVRVTGIDAVQKDMAEATARGEWVVNATELLGPVSSRVAVQMRATELAAIDRAFLKTSMGVAENGSVWLKESEMMNRLLPFICQHLVVVLEVADIVANMHEAYARIAGTDAGYHLFLAGPSKTADIEQSLVIGAHGARSLLVYLLDRS